MSDILTGKTIVITGASRGLGAGMAERFLERGAQLGVCARSTCSVGSHERVVAAQLDMSDSQAVAAFAQTVQEQLGDIDLWINNAGVLEPIRFVRDLSGEELEQHLRINVLGVLNGTHACR